MSKGENIFKRKDGRWEARYIKGYELSGKIKYGFCYGKTYKEAKEKVSACKAALLNGKSVPARNPRHRFAYYCDEWLANSKNQIRESTYVKYSNILEKYIKPRLGACFPLAVTSELIGRFTSELLYRDRLSSRTVRSILVELNSVLKYTSKQFPGTFPTVEIAYPKEQKKTENRVLSVEEQVRFVQYLLMDMDECKFGVLLSLFTGMRIGELCALTWSNISLDNHTIQITATMQRLSNMNINADSSKTKIVIGAPKSSTSIRTIPMTEQTVRLCKRMYRENLSAFILTGTDSYMEPRTLQYRLEKYTKECGLEGVHFHTLRHTFATRAVEVGFDIKSLSEILGHATTSITLNCYVHSSLELKRNNMCKLTSVGF